MICKQCTKCGKTKPLGEFHKKAASKDGHRPDCKVCATAYYREYYASHREKQRAWFRSHYAEHREKILARNRKRRAEHGEHVRAVDRKRYAEGNEVDQVLQRKYGLTRADYDAMLKEQDGKCAICGRTPKEEDRRLCVDHDHETGKVRGLLCNDCNSGLGRFHDDPARLQAAARYVAKTLL